MALRWKDLPKWQKDNKYIGSGYRKPSYSCCRSIKDIKKLHNETINIWSHLVAGVMFSIFLIQFLIQSGDLTLDVVAVFIFYFKVIICFTLLFIHHLLSNHSRKVMILTQRLDHLGVVIVIWSSAISFTFFGFYCSRQLQAHYISVITAAALIAILYASQPMFRHPESRLARTFTYFALGFSATLPAIYLAVRAQELTLCQSIILASYRDMIILNSMGGLFYSARIPERFYRNAFDIYGSSHQIMHTMVVCGALIYQTGLLTARQHWQNERVDGLGCTRA